MKENGIELTEIYYKQDTKFEIGDRISQNHKKSKTF